MVEFLRRAKPFFVEDPFKGTITREQGQAAAVAAVEIIDFLTTDAGIQWLASARQVALQIGSDDHEGPEGAVGDSPQRTA